MTDPTLYKKLYLAQALKEISYAVIHTDKITSVANSLLDAAINFTSAEAGSLMLLNERTELYILSSRGLPQEYVKSYRGKLGEGIAGNVAKNRRPVLVPDIDQQKDYCGKRRDHYKTRSFISCPVIYNEKLLGVININDKQDGSPFTSDEFDLLQIISNHAAIALENSTRLTQLKSAASELEQMNRRLIESDLLKTEFLTRISHELRTPLNALTGAIYFLQHEHTAESDRREFHGIIAAEAARLSTTVDTLLKFLQLEDDSRIIEKTVINIDDIFRELAASATLKATLKSRGIKLSVNALPAPLLIVGDKMRIGELFTSLLEGLGPHLEPGDVISLSAREVDHVLVEILLPRQLPNAILQHLNSAKSLFHRLPSDDRLKLYLSRNIIYAHRWSIDAHNATGSCAITLSIPRNSRETQNANINRSIDAFVDHISTALNLDICSVMLSDDISGELQVRSARGLDDDVIKRTRIKFGDKIAGWVALEGKPLFVENVEADERFAKKSTPQYNTKSFISLPLKIDDRVIGVLNLNNKQESEPFTERAFQTALALGDIMSDFLKRVYTNYFQEDEFQQFLSSVDALIRTESGQQVSQKIALADQKPDASRKA